VAPRSPELSPVDFYVRGHLKVIVYSPFNDVETRRGSRSREDSTPGELMAPYMNSYQNHLHVCWRERIFNVKKETFGPNVVN
jgi:hypothetical protein